ncbi:MAG: TspO/MBR family protein [Christensenellales bacterium]|nr:TspO/MBR family protein [Christensenellales bacterium]
MRINKKQLVICLIIPLVVGGLSALITGSSMDVFQSLNKPPLSPPGWLFPVVWTLLYLLMGLASYLVLTAERSEDDILWALIFYGGQLVFNFLWPIFFFSLSLYLFSFLWLVALWVLILLTGLLFYRLSKPAGYLLIPYLIWVTFAGYLNLGISLLN